MGESVHREPFKVAVETLFELHDIVPGKEGSKIRVPDGAVICTGREVGVPFEHIHAREKQ